MTAWRGTLAGVAAGFLLAAFTATAIAGPSEVLKAVTKSQVKKIATKRADALITQRAPGLTVASADSAERAERATDADALGGKPPSAYAGAQSEAARVIGAPGQPAFEHGWSNFDPNSPSASFYKDPLGVVHLNGFIQVNAGGNSASAFTLPPGYRPADTYVMPIAPLSVGQTGRVTLSDSGTVAPWCMESGGCTTSIDGVAFPAGS